MTSLPAQQALNRLSFGKVVQDTRISGTLELDPLVVSRWLCGEDLRGIYQPIVLHHCSLDGLDLEGRTFYEMVKLTHCRVTRADFKQAYFYSDLLIDRCTFEEHFYGCGIQNDGRVGIHDTRFNSGATFQGMNLRGEVDLVNVSFPGGTDLLHVLSEEAPELLGQSFRFKDCRFRPADIPSELNASSLGIQPLAEGDLHGAEGQWGEFIGPEEGDAISVVAGSQFAAQHVGAVDDDDVGVPVLPLGDDVEQASDLDVKAGLLATFTHSGLSRMLVEIDETSREGP